MVSDSKLELPLPVNQQKPRRRRILKVHLLIVALILSAVGYLGKGKWIWTPERKAHFVLTHFPLIDGHNDLPIYLRENYDNRLLNISLEHLPGQTDIFRLRQGHVGGQFWSVFVECPSLDSNSSLSWNRTGEYEAVTQTLQQIDVVKRMALYYPKTFSLTDHSGKVKFDFLRNHISSMMGIEGLHQIAGSPSILRQFYDLGVRYATLAHNCDNVFADAAVDGKRTNKGLSPAGRDIVREMNRLGMIVDLSHTTPETMHQALDVSVAPAFFSHSSAKGVYDHPRNVPDDVLIRVKETDGVVMVNFYPAFISPHPENATIDTVVEHIMHIANVTGSYRHIGLGGDFDGIDMVPKGLEDVSKYPDLFVKLAERGLSITELADIAGRNVLRVWKTTEDLGHSIHEPPLEWEDDF